MYVQGMVAVFFVFVFKLGGIAMPPNLLLSYGFLS